MRLHFNRKLVETLLAHAKAAPEHAPSYIEMADRITPKASLFLVGDDGIYLMSNGEPRLMAPENPKKALVCFARECNPETMNPEDCSAAKVEIYGGDDGVDTLSVEELEPILATYPPGRDLIIDLSGGQIGVIGYERRDSMIDLSGGRTPPSRKRSARGPRKTAGQRAYERDVAKTPAYHDGAPRRAWSDLGNIERDSWERNPTDPE